VRLIPVMTLKTANRKTFLLFLVATAASFLLLYGGHWVLVVLTKGRNLDAAGEYMSVFLYEVFLVLPAVSIVVGAFFGSLEQKGRWWMAGIALLPLQAFLLYQSFDRALLFLFCVYLILSLFSSWLVSLSREWRKAQNRF
jgi:hypothetical protein